MKWLVMTTVVGDLLDDSVSMIKTIKTNKQNSGRVLLFIGYRMIGPF